MFCTAAFRHDIHSKRTIIRNNTGTGIRNPFCIQSHIFSYRHRKIKRGTLTSGVVIPTRKNMPSICRDLGIDKPDLARDSLRDRRNPARSIQIKRNVRTVSVYGIQSYTAALRLFKRNGIKNPLRGVCHVLRRHYKLISQSVGHLLFAVIPAEESIPCLYCRQSHFFPITVQFVGRNVSGRSAQKILYALDIDMFVVRICDIGLRCLERNCVTSLLHGELFGQPHGFERVKIHVVHCTAAASQHFAHIIAVSVGKICPHHIVISGKLPAYKVVPFFGRHGQFVPRFVRRDIYIFVQRSAVKVGGYLFRLESLIKAPILSYRRAEIKLDVLACLYIPVHPFIELKPAGYGLSDIIRQQFSLNDAHLIIRSRGINIVIEVDVIIVFDIEIDEVTLDDSRAFADGEEIDVAAVVECEHLRTVDGCEAAVVVPSESVAVLNGKLHVHTRGKVKIVLVAYRVRTAYVVTLQLHIDIVMYAGILERIVEIARLFFALRGRLEVDILILIRRDDDLPPCRERQIIVGHDGCVVIALPHSIIPSQEPIAVTCRCGKGHQRAG